MAWRNTRSASAISVISSSPPTGIATFFWPAAIRRMASEDSMAFILVEQHADIALSLTQNAIVLERGRIVYHGASASLLADHAALDRLIGLRLAEV